MLNIQNEIKIKNTTYIGSPVARSEAKRLYRSFCNFQKVILDFKGISDIGQGYAHELFVVFKNEYPNIKAEVKNANSEVSRMINHVMQKKQQ